jgi:hypothetical protein
LPLDYELAFAIDSFALTPGAKSEMLGRIADAFRGLEHSYRYAGDGRPDHSAERSGCRRRRSSIATKRKPMSDPRLGERRRLVAASMSVAIFAE